MDEKLLKKLLHEHNEQDWFDFKSRLELYSLGKLIPQRRDELIKDILGMANGNTHIIRKTKYIIVGADNEKFDEQGMRILHDIEYQLPSQSLVMQWLSSVCTPVVVGITCEQIVFQEKNLFVVTIPPTFDLHETTRELTAKGQFHKNTVFMRQDEHTVPASVRDGVSIQQLKHLHRQEIANPPSIIIGALSGGIVALLFSSSIAESISATVAVSENFIQAVVTIVGLFFGAETGWVAKTLNETRYDWRYMNRKQRITILFFGSISFGAIWWSFFLR
jgi:hypothetical protein